MGQVEKGCTPYTGRMRSVDEDLPDVHPIYAFVCPSPDLTSTQSMREG